jgi:hypothetical protein
MSVGASDFGGQTMPKNHAMRKMLAFLAVFALAMVAAVALGTGQGQQDIAAAESAAFELPMVFVENHGQADDSTLYQASVPGSTFGLGRAGITMALDPGAGSANDEGDPAALLLRFVGANPDVVVEPGETASGRINLLLGNDPDEWHTNMAAYSSIAYWDLWDGIHLRVRSRAGALKN